MPSAVIVGGGVAGLVAAMLLRPLGYDVAVLERDAAAVPESVDLANRDWMRPTVPQALHSHAFTSLGTTVLRERLPELYAALTDAGAREIDLLSTMPAALRSSAPETADGELTVLACRRRTFDVVLAEIAQRSGVAVRRGVAVRGLRLERSPHSADPRVSGVRLADGGVLPADVVLDATGRRCASRLWLSEAGIPVAANEAWPSRFACYSRFYRTRGTALPGPLNRGNAAGSIFGHYMAFAHPGDNGTYSIGIGILPDDPALKALADEDVFTAVLAATPLLAPWVAKDAGEPLSPVHAITVPDNTLHGTATSRQRPVAGLFPVGDAACVSNPLYGRGVSLAIAHVSRLMDILAEEPEPGPRQSAEAAALVEALLVPWVRRAAEDDLERIRSWRTVVHGEVLPPLPQGYLGLGTAALAARFDAQVWHGVTRLQMSLGSPEDFYGSPLMRERVRAALEGRERPSVPAPGREELLGIVNGVGR